jgi:hypothetical protein
MEKPVVRLYIDTGEGQKDEREISNETKEDRGKQVNRGRRSELFYIFVTK